MCSDAAIAGNSVDTPITPKEGCSAVLTFVAADKTAMEARCARSCRGCCR
jgi:hypothetical protein